MDWLRRLLTRRPLHVDEELQRIDRQSPKRSLERLLEVAQQHPETTPFVTLHLVKQIETSTIAGISLLILIARDDRWAHLGRAEALRRLSKEAPDLALAPLRELQVYESEPLLCAIVAEALGNIDDPAVVPWLEVLLQDDTDCTDMFSCWRVMDDAARSLVRWRDMCPALSRWEQARLAELHTTRPRQAAISLGYVDHEAAIPPLVAYGRDGDVQALDLLERHRSPRVTKALCAALRQRGERGQIAQALGKRGDPSCIPSLVRVLANPRSGARACAARGLRWLEHPRAQRILADYADDPDPDVRKEVAYMVEQQNDEAK